MTAPRSSDPESPFGRLEPGAEPGPEAAQPGPTAWPEAPALAPAPGASAAPGAAPGLSVVEQPDAPSGEGAVERAITVASMVVGGLVAGALTTFIHRGRVDVGFGPVWIGIVGALACLALLAVGLRLYLRERGPSLGFAIGATIAILALASWSAGRSVIVLPDLVGLIWMVGAPAVLWLAASWPSLPAGSGEPDAAAAPRAAQSGPGRPAEYAGGSTADLEEPQP